jgi:hypothetical protein
MFLAFCELSNVITQGKGNEYVLEPTKSLGILSLRLAGYTTLNIIRFGGITEHSAPSPNIRRPSSYQQPPQRGTGTKADMWPLPRERRSYFISYAILCLLAAHLLAYDS